MLSHWLNQSQSIFVSRRISATSSSSLNDSEEPLLQRLSDMPMSFILRNLGVPNFALSLNASSVFASSARTSSSSKDGFILRALS